MRVLDEIAAERQRQIDDEGWTVDHDDDHRDGELARAAGCYALFAGGMTDMGGDDSGAWSMPQHWPWDRKWWKPKDPRHDLIRAAALIVAEVERLDRECLSDGATSPVPPAPLSWLDLYVVQKCAAIEGWEVLITSSLHKQMEALRERGLVDALTCEGSLFRTWSPTAAGYALLRVQP